MEIGLGIASMGMAARPESFRRKAELAERLKYDALWIGDHVIIPYQINSPYPFGNQWPGRLAVEPGDNVFEPLATLGFLAGAVKTPRLGISVLVLPYRNPIVTTKAIATLDVLSEGRVILGVGAGWMEEEFLALEAPPFASRGEVTDEYIQIFKELCTTESPNFQGKHYQLSELAFFPKPIQKPYPPIWVGGNTLTAMKRAARLGNGWNPAGLTPHEVVEKRALLRRLCEDAGRSPDEVKISLRGMVRFTEGQGNNRNPLQGNTQQVTDDLRRYQEAGVDHAILVPLGRTDEELIDVIERIAEDVRPNL